MIYFVKKVWATTFGNLPGNPENSAYGVKAFNAGFATVNPSGGYLLNPETRYVSLPATITDPTRVVVALLFKGNMAFGYPWDKGPGNTNDPYWRSGKRPMTERQYAIAKEYISQGYDPSKDAAMFPISAKGQIGYVIRNPAGIDLSPTLWVDLGVSRSTAFSGNFSGLLDAIAIIEM